MSPRTRRPVLLAVAIAAGWGVTARADDQLMLGGNFTRLVGIDGGGGSIAWLHGFDDRAKLSAGVDYEGIANADWTFGSLAAALITTASSGRKTSFAGEIHEGAGTIGSQHFSYGIEALGINSALSSRFTLQAEDRQIDVDTSHGNLPKLGGSMQWTPHWLTSAWFAYSAGGNLRTHLGMGRIDYLHSSVDVFAGTAIGHAAPAAVALEFYAIPPGAMYREQFIGVSKAWHRVVLLATLDHMDFNGVERGTFTLNCTIPL